MKNHIYAVYYRVLSVSKVEELLRFFRAHAEILSEDRNFLIIVSKDSADRLRDSVLQFLDSCEALLILEAGRSFASARWTSSPSGS